MGASLVAAAAVALALTLSLAQADTTPAFNPESPRPPRQSSPSNGLRIRPGRLLLATAYTGLAVAAEEVPWSGARTGFAYTGGIITGAALGVLASVGVYAASGAGKRDYYGLGGIGYGLVGAMVGAVGGVFIGRAVDRSSSRVPYYLVQPLPVAAILLHF